MPLQPSQRRPKKANSIGFQQFNFHISWWQLWANDWDPSHLNEDVPFPPPINSSGFQALRSKKIEWKVSQKNSLYTICLPNQPCFLFILLLSYQHRESFSPAALPVRRPPPSLLRASRLAPPVLPAATSATQAAVTNR